MISDPSLPLLKSHQKYDLALENLPDGVYAVANPKEVHGMKYTFSNDTASRFNLSHHIGLVDNSLVWGVSGFDSVYGKDNCSILIHPRTGERYLRVTPPKPESSNPVLGLDKHPDVTGTETYSLVLNLDERLDIIEEYDPVWREVRLRLGLKPSASKRSIVLCFDGTSNHFSDRNTNVVKLVELLKKDDPSQQMVYYQAGVGTYEHPGFMTGLSKWVAGKLDEGVAWYLYQHIIDGYKYLMETYRAGDQIILFGFSRGAYTARALAGMLHSVGLLSRHNIEQVPFAYQIYQHSQNTGKPNEKRTIGAMRLKPPVSDGNKILHWLYNATINTDASAAKNVDPNHFKMVFCTPVEISFLGVWDTVGSVGALTKKTLPHIEYNPSVNYFRQALALDETRANFIPSLWEHPSTKNEGTPNALEVWFKGGHTDVGGGAPQSKEVGNPKLGEPDSSRDLSNISLRWMVHQCLHCEGVRVLFDPDAMRRYRKDQILENHSPWATEDEIKAREEMKKPELLKRFSYAELPNLQRLSTATELELNERKITRREIQALKATHDEIRARTNLLDKFDITPEPYRALYTQCGSILWWFLEVLPVPKLSQRNSQRIWPGCKTAWCSNLGAARAANFLKPEAPINLHGSVVTYFLRNTGYKPAALWYTTPGIVHGAYGSKMSEKEKGFLSNGSERDHSLISRTRAARLFVGHVLMVAPIVMIAVYGFPTFIHQAGVEIHLPGSNLFGMGMLKSFVSGIMQGV